MTEDDGTLHEMMREQGKPIQVPDVRARDKREEWSGAYAVSSDGVRFDRDARERWDHC